MFQRRVSDGVIIVVLEFVTGAQEAASLRPTDYRKRNPNWGYVGQNASNDSFSDNKFISGLKGERE